MSFHTMTQPIACPPMEPSPSSFSAYSYSSSDDSMSYLDMYFLGTAPSTGTSTAGSVADFPLHQPAFEPSSLDSSSAMYCDFAPRFIYTPEAMPIMDAPTSYPTSSPASVSGAGSASSWSPTSMPVEQAMFHPLEAHQEVVHKPSKPYGCDDCGKSFTRPADLKRHQSTVHYPVFQNCPVPDCSRKDGNGFPRRDHLVEHLRSYHHMDVPKRRAAKRVRLA